MQRKEIPILFSTPMVQAILDGTKTQTRRTKSLIPFSRWRFINKLHGSIKDKLEWIYRFISQDNVPVNVKCPYGEIGDIIWVRETWKIHYVDEAITYRYKTGETMEVITDDLDRGAKHMEKMWDKGIFEQSPDNPDTCRVIKGKKVPWSPSIHMPKEAARIWLEVTDIRVERLQDINEADARNEGILRHKDKDGRIRYKDYMADGTVGIAATSFSTLWESINGLDSWGANPWVWVIEFKVLSTTGKPEEKGSILSAVNTTEWDRPVDDDIHD